MNLVVDIGNSRVKWGLAEGLILREQGVIDRDRAADLPAILDDRNIDAVWVACVAARQVAQPLLEWASRRRAVTHLAVSQARFKTLSNGYARPESLGVDRWMACIAAAFDARGSVLVADAGTALTLDFVDIDHRHAGGLIAPGVASMRHTLAGATALPAVINDVDDVELGRDTPAAIATGTRLAAAGLVNAVAATYPSDRRLLTGGQARVLAPHLDHDWLEIPELVLRGLARFAYAEQAG